MSNATLFIDLPNFLSGVLRSRLGSPRFLRDYVLYWLDFDLLAQSLTEIHSGIWIFYSGERIGPSSERIEGKYLQEYIRKINAYQGVTARDVNIPGEQREPSSYKCEKCAHEGFSETLSEKGVDSSLIVHLFDTMDSWDTAFLLSGDADFVPAVASLRRKGKIVIGVGFSNAAAALVRECYHYVNIEDVFLKQDVLAYTLFNNTGVINKWLSGEVKKDPIKTAAPIIEISLYLAPEGSWGRTEFVATSPSSYFVSLRFKGAMDMTERHKMIVELQKNYGSQISEDKDNDEIAGYQITGISYLGLQAINRRLSTSILSIPGLKILGKTNDRLECVMYYQLNESNDSYEVVSNPSNI